MGVGDIGVMQRYTSQWEEWRWREISPEGGCRGGLPEEDMEYPHSAQMDHRRPATAEEPSAIVSRELDCKRSMENTLNKLKGRRD